MTRQVDRGTTGKTGTADECVSKTIDRLGRSVHPHLDTTSPSLKPAPPMASYRVLRMRGLADEEAANLVAWLAGLHPVESGWTLKEIERLVLLRSMVTCGRLPS